MDHADAMEAVFDAAMVKCTSLSARWMLEKRQVCKLWRDVLFVRRDEGRLLIMGRYLASGTTFLGVPFLSRLWNPSCARVSVIGKLAFASTVVTAVDLSAFSALETIADRAFGNARWLLCLDLRACPALRLVGHGAFAGARLTTLHLPPELSALGVRAFLNARLRTLDLGACANLRSIGMHAFYLSQLTTLDATRTKLALVGTEAFYYSPLQTLRLPASVQTIGHRCFRHACLTALDLSGCGRLSSIGSAAFYDSPISTLSLSGCGRLECIGANAFHGARLRELCLAECARLEVIGTGAFASCQLNLLELPASLVAVGSNAFRHSVLRTLDASGCRALERIGEDAFRDSRLVALELPRGAGVSIGDRAFFSARVRAPDLRASGAAGAFGAAPLDTVVG